MHGVHACRDGDHGKASWFQRSSIFLVFGAQLFQKLPEDASAAAFERVAALTMDIPDMGTAAAAAVLLLRFVTASAIKYHGGEPH